MWFWAVGVFEAWCRGVSVDMSMSIGYVYIQKH